MLQDQDAIELQSPSGFNAEYQLRAPQHDRGAFPSSSKSNSTDMAASRPQYTLRPSSTTLLSRTRSNIVIAVLTLVLFINSIVTGFITVGIPSIAADLALEPSLLLWPQSVYGLTSGSCLLLAGAVADVIGSRLVNLTGTFFMGVFIIAGGLSRTGIQLIIFRAMQGIAIALVMPTGMGIVSIAIPNGTRRNLAFSLLGIGQLLGYALGLVLSGVFVDTVGWRAGFFMTGGLTLATFIVGLWALPSDQLAEKPTLKRLWHEVDWIGAGVASTCLVMFSYVLAYVMIPPSVSSSKLSMILLTICHVQDVDFRHYSHKTTCEHRPAKYESGTSTNFYLLDRTTRTSWKTSSDPKLHLEERAIPNSVSHDTVVVRCDAGHGAFCELIVSLPGVLCCSIEIFKSAVLLGRSNSGVHLD